MEGRTMTSSGVYLIRNRCSGRVYVGSSDSIERRFSQHRRQLRRGIHPKPLLQEDWDRDGSDIFDWEIVHTFRYDGAAASWEATRQAMRETELRTIQELYDNGIPLYNSDRLRATTFLTIQQAADRIGVHANTLRSWADDGKVPMVKLPSGYRRFDPDVIERIRKEMGISDEVQDSDTGNNGGVLDY